MFGSGKRRPAPPPAPLGTALVALRVHGDAGLPPGCVELVFSAAGQARRAPHSRAGKGEIALAYHPGPYETEFAPFAGAPEIGLRLRYLADAADPRVAQQRFDLFLFSEAGEALSVEALHQAIAATVRDALAQGALDLPACTTLDEWHAFRAGLNELLYVRFGLTVDDCVPVDLGEACDYAAVLRARAARPDPVGDMVQHRPDRAAGDVRAGASIVDGNRAGRFSGRCPPTAGACNMSVTPAGVTWPPGGSGRACAAAGPRGTGLHAMAASLRLTALRYLRPSSKSHDAQPPRAGAATGGASQAAVAGGLPDADSGVSRSGQASAAGAGRAQGGGSGCLAGQGHVLPAATTAAPALSASSGGTATGFAQALSASSEGAATAVAPAFSSPSDGAATGVVAQALSAPTDSINADADADADADAHALRRLFLELPAWTAGVRALPLPSGPALFAARRDVLQRCALAALEVNTMPALAWAAPHVPLALASQARRAAHSVAAAQALDQAWALLARWRLAAQAAAPLGTALAAAHAAWLDEADRLTANLAFHLAARRALPEQPETMEQRKEPHL